MTPADKNAAHSAPARPGKSWAKRFWRAFWIAFLAASLAYAWYSFYAPANDVAWADDLDAARSAAVAADRPMMLFFTASWCSPCRIMKREVFADGAVARAINAGVVPVMIHAEEPGADAVFEHYQVGGTPVTIFTDPQGAVIDYGVGRMAKAEFLAMLGGLDARRAASSP
ncbi:thioredoxin family protein [bacterium]|nr:thioredoxin family protein [bacterium]